MSSMVYKQCRIKPHICKRWDMWLFVGCPDFRLNNQAIIFIGRLNRPVEMEYQRRHLEALAAKENK